VDDRPFAPWEPSQVGEFLDVAAQHRLGAFFELAVWTGLRRRELVELLWSDVDFAGRTIRVRRSTTKTESGARTVPLGDHAAGVLVAWQIAQAAERVNAAHLWSESGHVFTMEDGRQLRLQYATRLFARLLAQTDLPTITLHGLRHMCASIHIASGSDIEYVSKLLGHSDVRVTSSIYSHMLQSTGQRNANNAAASVPRKGQAHTLHAQGGEKEEKAAPAFGGNGL
jgi:integrase